MIAGVGAIGALIAVLFGAGIVVCLFFANRKLGLVGLVVFLVWLFALPMWDIAKYRYAMWQTGFDHYRETQTTHFGVTLPDDGSFWRSPKDFLENPAYGLGFRTTVEGLDQQIGFIINNTQTNLHFDFLGCSYADGPYGLRKVITESCDNPDHHASDFVFTTQPDDPNTAISIQHSFADVEDLRILRFVHGDAIVHAFVGSDLRIGLPKLPLSSWKSIRDTIIPLLDAHFVFNPPT